MNGVFRPLSASARTGWYKFRIAEALGPGEHEVDVVGCSINVGGMAYSSGPPVLLDVCGTDYDEQDRPTAVIEAFHPDIDGIGWDDIWEAVRRQYPSSSPVRRATESEYQAVKESIAAFGSLQRVIVDEMGNVIAGQSRQRACAELGQHCPTEVICGLTQDQKDQLSFQLDFCRKHLSSDDKRRAAESILRANPRNSDRVIGRAVGLDHRTVGTIRDELEERGEIPQVTQRQGGDGKTYKFTKIAADTKKEAERAKTGLQVLGPDAPKKPLNLGRAEDWCGSKKAAERKPIRRRPPLLPDDSIQILHSDFQRFEDRGRVSAAVPGRSALRPRSLPLYEDIGRFAARNSDPMVFWLPTLGSCTLPEILAAMTTPPEFRLAR